MLKFIDFITEAKIEHFVHIGLNKDNPEHRDIVDAFNQSGSKLAKKNPNQYKSMDELKDAVSDKLSEIQTKKQHDKEDSEAMERGDAELVHHDPKTGLKVYKVKNQKGCTAVGKGTKWCVAKRGGHTMRQYDSSGEHSYVIHTPEKGNLSRIGIIGMRPGEKHTDGEGGNFQDKGNNTVSDEDWNHMRKKYGLDKIHHLEGIRGIPISDKRKKKIHDKISKDLDSSDGGDRYRAASHPMATKEQLDKAVRGDYSSKAGVANNQNATEEHLHKLLDDPELDDYHIKADVLYHRNATSSHIDKALDDKDEMVRMTAAQHPKATEKHLAKALNDETEEVREEANYNAERRGLDPEKLRKSYNKTNTTNDPKVARSWRRNESVTLEKIKRILY